MSAHVIVGLSGGVDSAVAALLLKRQGYRITGLFMKNWEEDDTAGHCTAEDDLKMARAVCKRLDIPLQTVNFSAEYWERVFEYFLAEHRAGRTPNPDVLCNQEIKFKAFLEHALGLGADFIATGHYARVETRDGHARLLKARDTNKDQTYFLYAVSQAALARTLFPLGELAKPEVRRLAHEAGLPNFDRKDSTGICFIGERNYQEFLTRFLPAQPGEIRTLAGQLKGRHEGLMHYTLGQRHGLGIGGPGEPWYVVDKDLAANILYVEQGENHPALYRQGLTATRLRWIGGTQSAAPARLTAKTRYRQPEQACTLALEGNQAQVVFDQPQRALTPGQSVVFYREDECLGGGIIEATLPAALPATPSAHLVESG
jgi:tRNA-specific 2-thiouridylase